MPSCDISCRYIAKLQESRARVVREDEDWPKWAESKQNERISLMLIVASTWAIEADVWPLDCAQSSPNECGLNDKPTD